MPQTAPTKGNLTAAKRSRSLASTGYELMDRKRNILIRELMALIDDSSMGGSARLAADSVPVDDGFSLRTRSVMGVELPYVSVKSEEVRRPPYGLSFTSSELDEAYFKFREVKDLIRDLAETENSIYRLAYAIKKAQKRANALKNIVIPGLDSEIFRISDALEEKEREEFVRLKVVKGRNERLKGEQNAQND